MSNDNDLNEHGNHQGEFSQGVGGWAEYTVYMTETKDTVRHDIKVPPGKVIPVIFLPGVMGSNLRLSALRQDQLRRTDNRAWRPDDIENTDVIAGNGIGNWFKNATPAQRQLNFDPNETEVEYYHYTESRERFDPDGAVTRESDTRHQNVPDGLSAIPPLMAKTRTSSAAHAKGDSPAKRPAATVAQIARWRGWSEVLFKGAYGDMLQVTERFMNNILVQGKIARPWNVDYTAYYGGDVSNMPHPNVSKLLRQSPKAFGATAGAAITEADLKKIAPCWYPVHAMGYNFIKSNGESALVIADRIRGLVAGYKKRGFKCDEVIIVTHSMGGLLGRALIHPKYGNMLNDKNVKVLGIYHGAMPTIGAAGAYKRMRFGFKESWGPAASYEAKVLGRDGEHATAILANAPAPLEMMPGAAYGPNWLKIVDHFDELMCSWPSAAGNALDDIYLKPAKAWWRLVNPLWVNPGNVIKEKGGGIAKVYKRLEAASQFLSSIETTFHPITYASYCASPEQITYGEVVFKITNVVGNRFNSKGLVPWPPVETWALLTDDKVGELKVQAGHCVITLTLQPSKAPGDGTVPSGRSAQHIKGMRFEHGKEKGKGYEHQNSYADPQVQASMLFSIVQIAKIAKWP